MSDHSNQPEATTGQWSSVNTWRGSDPMTVADLIARLATMPPETPVHLGGSWKDWHRPPTAVALDDRGFVRIDG